MTTQTSVMNSAAPLAGRMVIVFAAHLWNPHGAEPQSIRDVPNRQKDVQYSSRAHSHIKRQRQLHKLRHVIQQLSPLVPNDAATAEDLATLRSYGCETKMLHETVGGSIFDDLQ